jgi:hypothetical protein
MMLQAQSTINKCRRLVMSKRVILAAGLLSALAGSPLLAAPALTDCRAVADRDARLACYDALPSGAPAAAQTAAPTPAPMAASPSPSAPAPMAAAPAATPSAVAASDTARRSNFDSHLVAVVPQRHGYYRLELEDGSAYLTTSVGPPPPVGAEVHIRRTFVGTTYLDLAGWDPIAIRLTKRR